MGFRINTNVGAMNAHANAVMNNREMDISLARLSSGLRINTAADDASGMSIADSLKSQAHALGQATRNANDAIGIIQTADKAMDEQIKILDTIKVKATQAAQDGQSALSRQALQNDIVRLMEELDNIATTTSFNGQSLLAGSFTNKEFQIGAYSNQTVRASIGATSSDKIGSVRFETTKTVTASGISSLVFRNADGTVITLQGTTISYAAGTGLGVLTEVINKAADSTGVRASYKVISTGSSAVAAGTLKNLVLNGITIGDVVGIKNSDSSGVLVNAVNAVTHQTGIYASVDIMGRLNFTSLDGRGIVTTSTTTAGASSSAITGIVGISAGQNYGRLTLTTLSSRDILVSDSGPMATTLNSAGSNTTLNLRDVKGNFTASQGQAAGAYANRAESGGASTYLGSGVTTKTGAMMVMDIAESAMRLLDKIRSDLGSAQNQLISTINNISVTEVQVTSAESQIRDVDFAQESANFSKRNILAQSGSFAMAQANTVQQNVLKLLQ